MNEDDLGDWVLVGDVARGVFAAYRRDNFTRENAVEKEKAGCANLETQPAVADTQGEEVCVPE